MGTIQGRKKAGGVRQILFIMLVFLDQGNLITFVSVNVYAFCAAALCSPKQFIALREKESWKNNTYIPYRTPRMNEHRATSHISNSFQYKLTNPLIVWLDLGLVNQCMY